MFDELTNYKHNGHFFFERGQTLSQVCNAPDEPGVYYIVMLRKGKVRLAYIGASGTINQKGKLSKPFLRGGINAKPDGVNRQIFFEELMLKNEIDALDIYWFVTFDKDNQHLPAYVEALLLQKYYEHFGCLPEWNKAY